MEHTTAPQQPTKSSQSTQPHRAVQLNLRGEDIHCVFDSKMTIEQENARCILTKTRKSTQKQDINPQNRRKVRKHPALNNKTVKKHTNTQNLTIKFQKST